VKARGRNLAFIWSAFPGFTYEELLNLDIRDRDFWIEEARRKRIEDQIRACGVARMGQANDESYERIMNEMKRELRGMEDPQPKRWAKTWTEALGIRKG